MLCRFCFSHRNFGCFDLVCSIVPSTFVIFPIGITVIFNIICLWMGKIYAATPGQNSGVARISILFYYYIILYYIYIYIYHLSIPNPNVPMLLFTHRPFQPAPARPPWSGYSETPPKPTSPGLRVAWFHTFHWEKTWENRTKPWQNMAGWWLSPTPLKNMNSSMGRMTSHIWNGK